MTFFPKYYGASNIFITPDLYRNVQDNFLQIFRQILNDNEININILHEFKCSTTTAVAIEEEDFVLPDFKFKVEFSDQTASDGVKKLLIQKKIF